MQMEIQMISRTSQTTQMASSLCNPKQSFGTQTGFVRQFSIFTGSSCKVSESFDNSEGVFILLGIPKEFSETLQKFLGTFV